MVDYKIYNDNNLAALNRLADNSLDAIVTDAPYGLGKEPNAEQLIKAWVDTGYLEIKGKGFMGKEWDAFVPQPAFWKEVYRVLKPGGYVLCFFGTRTYDWGTLAIRLAGFEIRDCIQWIYGSGFPKSLDVSKAIDKNNGKWEIDLTPFGEYVRECRQKKGYTLSALDEIMGTSTAASWWEGRKDGVQLPAKVTYEGLKKVLDMDGRFDGLIDWIEAEREVVAVQEGTLLAVAPGQQNDRSQTQINVTSPTTEQAKTWDGYGTALKPAYEPICVARKPLVGTVAENVLKHGCGAINLDGCRIPTEDNLTGGTGILFSHQRDNTIPVEPDINKKGRFPANIIMDEEAASILDQQSGQLTSGQPIGIANKTQRNTYGKFAGNIPITGYGDTGGASRFFYCAKASTSDRDYGLSIAPSAGGFKNGSGRGINGSYSPVVRRNTHPTVKPIALMRYLVRLVKTPFETCTIMDPFLGSGTTGIACMLEGINFIGCEMEADSYAIAAVRIEYAKQEYIKEQSKPKQTLLF